MITKEVQKNKRKRLLQIKTNLKCSLCSEAESCCLDFHHLDPSEKEDTLSNMVSRASWEKIVEEINKCIVLCSNCHRKYHSGKVSLEGLNPINVERI